jgi:hypothetical protein
MCFAACLQNKGSLFFVMLEYSTGFGKMLSFLYEAICGVLG